MACSSHFPLMESNFERASEAKSTAAFGPSSSCLSQVGHTVTLALVVAQLTAASPNNDASAAGQRAAQRIEASGETNLQSVDAGVATLAEPLQILLDRLDGCEEFLREASPSATPELLRAVCSCAVDQARPEHRAPVHREVSACVDRVAKEPGRVRSRRRPTAVKADNDRYIVDVADNSESFVFRSRGGSPRLFKAKTYCFGIFEGDEVLFYEGGPDKSCTTAAFIKTRGGTGGKCEVWCPFS